MDNKLPNCWEITNCGREKGGCREGELGECVASKQGMGHSCWAVAGTLGNGGDRCTLVQKFYICNICEVFHMYNRRQGSRRKEVISRCPEEESLYLNFMFNKSGAL